jgi:Uma2 family endonuclease
MAPHVADTATKLTYEDLVALPEDGLRHEILDGEHVVSPSPSLRHQTIVLNLAHAILPHVRQHRLGRVFIAPLDVLLGKHDVVEPDLLFVSGDRSEILAAANVQGAPDLHVEVLSSWSRRRDEVVKRERYERLGVAEYWVVDPEAETVKVFRRGAGEGFGRPTLLSLHQGESLTSPLLPGLELPLEVVFAE